VGRAHFENLPAPAVTRERISAVLP